ncbi:uncharacterized protein LOC113502494 [Trichoplusia ni]|uniref:Uncharacterized protein LOC113502494 n=1 Tax=Trichoplusia ni TaxID=7111 RepID=A0A7E5WGR5_TRINI|nr:uncharacterized protein LOC113502494 [Trichoplusia ni]
MEDHNLSYEPMDIDLSGHSVKEMDISDVSYNDSPIKVKREMEKPHRFEQNLDLSRGSPIKSPVIKKFHLNREKPTRNSEGTTRRIITILLIGVIPLLISAIYNIKCYDDINLNVLSEALSNRLFGQSEAIRIMLDTLGLEERSKILIFSGGTGVGKTYASSILLETVGSCSNVYHYTMPSFVNSFTTDFMVGLTICKNSLVILDDLTVDDIHIKKQIKELIDKSQQLDKNLTVILIFNCHEATTEFIKKCDESFQSKVLEQFAEINAIKQIVNFKSLDVTHLKKCIKHEVQGRVISDEEFDEILKNFDVTLDGCKGVHSKMKYLNVV